jgi:hypothetical protein
MHLQVIIIIIIIIIINEIHATDFSKVAFTWSRNLLLWNVTVRPHHHESPPTHHWTRSWSRSILFAPAQPIPQSFIFNIRLRQGLPGSFISEAFVVSHVLATCPAHLNHHKHTTVDGKYKSWNALVVCNCPVFLGSLFSYVYIPYRCSSVYF